MANKNEKKEIRFFCGLETMQTLMQLQKPDPAALRAAAVAEFDLDVIELPYCLSYSANRRTCTVSVYKRSEIGINYKKGPDSEVIVTLSNGNAAYAENQEFNQQNLTLFFVVCFNLAKYAVENGFLRKSDGKSGILLKTEGSRIVAKDVSGFDRPALMCTTLFGAQQYGRPYEDELFAQLAVDAMSVDQMEKLAEAGDISVMERLCQGYLRGDEKLDQNFVKSAYWARKMADAGISVAMFNLGLRYAKGCGVERDLGQAVLWMKKARDAGDGDAEKLITLYEKAEKDRIKAEAGDVQAMADYARFLMSIGGSLQEAGPGKDYAESFEWAKKAAAQFNLDGIYTMALCYEHGRGVEEDCAKAFKLYERAALKGHAPSMTNLGCLYGRGEGVQKDEVKGMEWLQKAAELKDPDALRILGMEKKEAKDILEGTDIDWLLAAVKKGDKEASKLYATACLQGSKYIEDTFEHGEQILNELAAKGDTESLRILGFVYASKSSDGEKLYKDMMLKAISYYERIGDELYTNAEMAMELAACYSWMPEVKNALDNHLAIFWYKVSADLGNAEARRMYSLVTFTRDNKAKYGCQNDADFLHYIAQNNKMEEAYQYNPYYKPTRAEHERLYKTFLAKTYGDQPKTPDTRKTSDQEQEYSQYLKETERKQQEADAERARQLKLQEEQKRREKAEQERAEQRQIEEETAKQKAEEKAAAVKDPQIQSKLSEAAVKTTLKRKRSAQDINWNRVFLISAIISVFIAIIGVASESPDSGVGTFLGFAGLIMAFLFLICLMVSGVRGPTWVRKYVSIKDEVVTVHDRSGIKPYMFSTDDSWVYYREGIGYVKTHVKSIVLENPEDLAAARNSRVSHLLSGNTFRMHLPRSAAEKVISFLNGK